MLLHPVILTDMPDIPAGKPVPTHNLLFTQNITDTIATDKLTFSLLLKRHKKLLFHLFHLHPTWCSKQFALFLNFLCLTY